MNICRLNQKLRLIMEVHDIINRDNLQGLQNSYIGIHQDYLFHQVVKLNNFLTINYDEIYCNIASFFKTLKDNNIQVLVVLSQNTNNVLNTQVIMQTSLERNHSQFSELVYNDSFIESLIPKKLLMKWLTTLEIQYIVAPSVGTQLRYLFTNNLISGILSEISILEQCFGFKELNHLIINIFDDSFEWIDIKTLTAKSQLNLDSLSELFSLYDYCTLNDTICYSEQILNSTSQQRQEKQFDQLSRRLQSDILYNISQQLFAGKLTFSQRIQKFTANLIEPNKILSFISTVKEQPSIDIYCDQFRLAIPSGNWTQYPTELLLFQHNGLCLYSKCKHLLNSWELQEYESIDPQHIIFEKLNLGYLQGQNQQRMSIYNGLFKDYIKNATLQRAIHYYYKKLKLASRKSSFEIGGEQVTTVGKDMIALNVHLRFLHLVNLVDLDHEKGSLFASALSYVKPEYFIPFFIYLKLLESPLQYILFKPFYAYSAQDDEDVVKAFQEKQNELQKRIMEIQQEWVDEKDIRIILLLRFFILISKSSQHKPNQFSELITKISHNYAEVYEAILFSLYLDINQKNSIEYFFQIGVDNPFVRQFNYDPDFYLFLSKKLTKFEFSKKHDLQQYLECWKDFVKMFEYINQKKGQKYDDLGRANEYLLSLIK